MIDQAPQPRVSDIDLAAMIATYNAGRITHGFAAEVLRCLYELSNRRAADSLTRAPEYSRLQDRAAQPPEVAQWQPIKTAPKDGTEVALLFPHEDEIFGKAFPRVRAGAWCNSTWSLPHFYAPTHWHPLPESPRAAGPASPSALLWTSNVKLALLDIAHHAYHIVDDSEADETDDHTKVCEALDRLEPDSKDPHERIAQLRATVETTQCRHQDQRHGDKGPAYCADCGTALSEAAETGSPL